MLMIDLYYELIGILINDVETHKLLYMDIDDFIFSIVFHMFIIVNVGF